MRGACNAALRTRMVRATIGVVLVGGIAGLAAAQTVRGSVGTPTVAASSSATPTATAASISTPTAKIIVASGTIARIDPVASTLILVQDSGSQQVIDVSSATQFVGDVGTLGQLQTGMRAQVTGQMLADGSLSALALVTRLRDG